MKVPPLRMPCLVLTAQLENGLFWSEALRFPEFSRLAGRPPHPPLRQSLQKYMEGLSPLELCFRQIPLEGQVELFGVEISTPRKMALWREPFQLQVYGYVYQPGAVSREGQNLWSAYLPEWNLECLAFSREELGAQVEQEVRAELQRQPELMHVLQLIYRQRWRSLTHHTEELEVSRPAEKQVEEENLLGQLSSRLDQVKRDLPKAYEVDSQLSLLADFLQGEQPQNVLLVGPSGSGKTALVHELVRRRYDFGLAQRPFYETSGARLLVGEVAFGAWQERCQKWIGQASKARAVVHLGHLQELLESARHQTVPYGLAGFFRPYLSSHRLLATAEATPEELAYVEREYPQILEAFAIFQVEAADGARTRRILAQAFESVSEVAREAVAELHQRFCSLSASPGWPVRFLRGVTLARRKPEVADVHRRFSQQTGLPLLFLDEQQPFAVDSVQQWFESRLHGQAAAVARVVERLEAFKNGLTRSGRPIASFLLVGPTGVGKTELARCLAEFVFQDRQCLTRFDMSEYSDGWSVRRLIEGDPGLLVAAVRDRPFQVLLLDELEKAHPSFFDLLLQVLGDARLSDSSGRVADFSNCLILMTSNLGADRFLRGSLGLRTSGRQEGDFLEAVRAAFRPELLNRIDEVLGFLPLTPESVLRIARQELDALAAREGLRERPLQLVISEGVAEYVASRGYDRRYGARPLKRTLEKLILAPLSEQLNGHPAQVPLRVVMDLTGEPVRLRLEVFPQVALDKALAQESRQRRWGEEISHLRRRFVRLEGGPTLIELQNESLRYLKRHRQKWPHQGFLEEVGALRPAIELLEERALAALAQEGDFGALVEQRRQLSEQLDEAIVKAFCLSQEDTDSVLVAGYSEQSAVLRAWAWSLWQECRERKWQVRAEQVTVRKGQPSRGKGPPLSARLQKLVSEQGLELFWVDELWTTRPHLKRTAVELQPQGEAVLGFLLEVKGRFCRPWLQGEAGLHQWTRRDHKCDLLVEISQAPLNINEETFPHGPPAYLPPAEIHRRGSIQHPVLVRSWNLEEEILVDGMVGKLSGDLSQLGTVLRKRLLHQAEKACLR